MLENNAAWRCGNRTLVLNDQGGAVMDISYDVTATLRSQEHGHQPIILVGGVYAMHQNGSGEIQISETAYTVGTTANASARQTPLIFDARGNGGGAVCPTITGDHQNRITDYTAVVVTTEEQTDDS